jgi:hypothetical protein
MTLSTKTHSAERFANPHSICQFSWMLHCNQSNLSTVITPFSMQDTPCGTRSVWKQDIVQFALIIPAAIAHFQVHFGQLNSTIYPPSNFELPIVIFRLHEALNSRSMPSVFCFSIIDGYQRASPARLGAATQAISTAAVVLLCSHREPITPSNGISNFLIPPSPQQFPLSPLASSSSWPCRTLPCLSITLGIVECNISPLGETAGPPMVPAVRIYLSRSTTRTCFVARLLYVTFIFSCVCAYLVAKMRTFEWAVLGLGVVSGVKALTPE